VLEPDDVVDDRRHRPSLGLGVAVGERDRDLLVRGEQGSGVRSPELTSESGRPRNVAPGFSATCSMPAARSRSTTRSEPYRMVCGLYHRLIECGQ
jgi:hypothetical protein